jgi:hypothetical protein
MPRHLALAAGLALALATASPAHAQDGATTPTPDASPTPETTEPSTTPSATTPSAPTEEYRQTVASAIAEFDERNFDEALALFERAYAMRPSARVLRGIGKVRYEQRQYVHALEAFEEALASTTDPLTDEMRAEVEDLRQRTLAYVGELTISVLPASAHVVVDGRELPADTRYPIRLDLGAHLVSASAEGHQPASRTVDIAGGQGTSLTIDLIQQQSSVVVLTSTPDRTGMWVTAAIGVALVGATVGSAVWMVDRLDAASRCSAAEARGVTCATASAIGGERDASMGTLVASSVLTAAAVVTFVVLATQDESAHEEATPTVVCAPSADGAGCSVWGRF